MTLNELIAGIASRFSVEGLAADGGMVSIKVDDMHVTIAEGGDAFVVTGLVCEQPAEHGETFANMLLDATTVFMDTRSVALARNPESEAYVLVERISTGLDLDGFCDALRKFIDTLEDCVKAAANFGPAMESADKSLEKDEPPMQFGALLNGFIRV
ncbi:MAG: type III secretion system chaperone [Victivallales bacterium]|nr:type III secretion system chaperone [Victivallales bacterium]